MVMFHKWTPLMVNVRMLADEETEGENLGMTLRTMVHVCESARLLWRRACIVVHASGTFNTHPRWWQFLRMVCEATTGAETSVVLILRSGQELRIEMVPHLARMMGSNLRTIVVERNASIGAARHIAAMLSRAQNVEVLEHKGSKNYVKGSMAWAASPRFMFVPWPGTLRTLRPSEKTLNVDHRGVVTILESIELGSLQEMTIRDIWETDRCQKLVFDRALKAQREWQAAAEMEAEAERAAALEAKATASAKSDL